MHVLDTVMTPVDLYDTVTLAKSCDGKISVFYDGKESGYKFDTALITAERIAARYNLGGVKIDIKKRIPEGAGLGGSSADAAGVARGMEELFKYGKTDTAILAAVGSDVCAMYFDAPCRVRGIGEEVTPVEIAKKIYFAVCVCKDGVGTKECYETYDKVGGEGKSGEETVKALKSGEYFYPVNDLYPAAVAINPTVKLMREAVERAGFISGMTGSGCAVFGYEYDGKAFKDKSDRLKNLANGKFEIITL